MNKIGVLFLGDIIGKPGCRALFFKLKDLIKETGAQFVIANGENADEGFGITPDLAQKFLDAGVDVLTSGNHIWQKREIVPFLETKETLLRPLNYPSGNPGKGVTIIKKSGYTFAVINASGRIRMGNNLDCPFRAVKKEVGKIRSKTKLIFVDFHAESSREKEALSFYLDGSITAIVGTHTHVQTMDEKILPKGTGYLSDLGMVGPLNGVIGTRSEISIKRSLTQIPEKMEILDEDAVLQGLFLEADPETGKTISLKRINYS